MRNTVKGNSNTLLSRLKLSHRNRDEMGCKRTLCGANELGLYF